MTDLQKKLIVAGDQKHKAFSSKLMPTIDPGTVLGIKTPELRAIAKEFAKDPASKAFVKQLPHEYFEENCIHAFLIANMKDFDECIKALDAFLPYVDNWATCDTMRPRIFDKHKRELLTSIDRWLADDKVYTIRFGFEMLMNLYLDDSFDPKFLKKVSGIKSDEYYVNMMIAWYFATALAKQYKATIPYLETQTLDTWTHNKTIQKAIESYRITEEQKAYLRTLKIKS